MLRPSGTMTVGKLPQSYSRAFWGKILFLIGSTTSNSLVNLNPSLRAARDRFKNFVKPFLAISVVTGKSSFAYDKAPEPTQEKWKLQTMGKASKQTGLTRAVDIAQLVPLQAIHGGQQKRYAISPDDGLGSARVPAILQVVQKYSVRLVRLGVWAVSAQFFRSRLCQVLEKLIDGYGLSW